MTVVYLDTVMLFNGILDYLLLRSAGGLTAAPRRRGRLALAALLGGVYSGAVFLPGCAFLAGWPWRMALAAGMTAVAYGAGPGWLRVFLSFLALSWGLAGLLVLLSLGWDRANFSFPRGIPVTGPDWKGLLLAAALCYWLSSTLLRRLVPVRGGVLIPVTLALEGREVRLTALQDSGNLLTDPRGGEGVLVTGWQTAAALLPPGAALTQEDAACPTEGMVRLGALWRPERLTLLPYQGVGSNGGLLLALRLDRGDYGGRRVKSPLVALAPEGFSQGEYQGVIGVS